MEKHMQYIEKRMNIIQDLKHEVQETMIQEEDLNALDESNSITEEKMM